MGEPRSATPAHGPERWMHLLHLAEELRARSAIGGVSATELQLYLGSVDEAFAEGSDPLEDFAAYALRRFCRQLSESIGAVRAHR